MSEHDDCTCEFDPYEDGDVNEESWHFKRTCETCGEVWWALHCPHDGIQNPCPDCGWIGVGKKTPLQSLFGRDRLMGPPDVDR